MRAGHKWKLFTLANGLTRSESRLGTDRSIFNYTLKVHCGVGLGDLRIISRDDVTEMQGAFLRSRNSRKVDSLFSELPHFETGTQSVGVQP